MEGKNDHPKIIIIIFLWVDSNYQAFTWGKTKLLTKKYYHHCPLSSPRWFDVHWREEKIIVQVTEKTSIQLWSPQIRGCQFQFIITRGWLNSLGFEQTNVKTITKTKTKTRQENLQRQMQIRGCQFRFIMTRRWVIKPSRFRGVFGLIYKHFLGIWRWAL